MTIEENEPSYEDPTPNTRFIRHVPSGSVALPNAKWFRSPKQRDYALCFDQDNAFFGWLMLEGWQDNWVSVRRLTQEDLINLRDVLMTGTAGAEHRPAIQLLIDRGHQHLENERRRGG